MLVQLLAALALAQSSPWPSLAEPQPSAGGVADAAVIVAVEDYAYLPDVPGAVRNGWDWHAWLRARGVPSSRISTLFDPLGRQGEPMARREAILREVQTRAAQVDSGGSLWVVFIGHGAPASHGKDGVLVGTDAGSQPDSLYARSVPRSELLEHASDASDVVLVLDACFTGQTGSGQALTPGLQPVIPTAMARSEALELLAGAQFSGPLPGEERPAFSYLLLGALQGWGDADQDGLVTSGEAWSYARETLLGLSDVTGRAQQPVLRGPESRVLGQGRARGPDLFTVKRQLVGGVPTPPLPEPVALAPEPRGLVPSASSLVGTTWIEHCPGSRPGKAWIQLRADGTFAWSYKGPRKWTVDGGETWVVRRDELVISWNGGYAHTTCSLGVGDSLFGVSTKGCVPQARLERVRQ